MSYLPTQDEMADALDRVKDALRHGWDGLVPKKTPTINEEDTAPYTNEVYVAPSGARSSEQKPRYDLIPLVALEREAKRMAEGAKAHGELNYLKGRNDPIYIRERANHLLDHALKYLAGDTSTDHLSAIRCNAGMLMVLTQDSDKSDPTRA